MSDAALLHEDLLSLEEDTRRLLQRLEDGSASGGEARSGAITAAQGHLGRITKLQHQLRVEARRVADPAEQKDFEAKVRRHNEVVNELKSRLVACRTRTTTAAAAAATTTTTTTTTTAVAAGAPVKIVSSVEPAGESALFRDPQSSAGTAWSPREDASADDGKGQAREVATRIQSVQVSALASLQQTQRLLHETETMGNEAGTTLQRQTEQIQQTNDQLDEMGSELGLAKKELKAFMRRMARDRIIIFFAIVIVLCIIAIVVLGIIKAKT